MSEKFGYGIGYKPERYENATYPSHRAALLAAIREEGLGVGDNVTTCRARYLEPGAILTNAFELDRLCEIAQEDEDLAWMDDSYFDYGKDAEQWLNERVEALFDEWAATFNVTSGTYYVGEDSTPHVVTAEDIVEAKASPQVTP